MHEFFRASFGKRSLRPGHSPADGAGGNLAFADYLDGDAHTRAHRSRPRCIPAVEKNNMTTYHDKLKQLDHSCLWHPFTQMQEWMGEDPIIISRADGHYLMDDQGRKYLDGVSSLWCNVHGHRKKEIDEAIREQLDRVAHSTFLGLSHVPGIQLAQKLIGIAPKGLRRVF